MNAQMTSAVQNNEAIGEEVKQGEVFTINPEVLNMVGGGEGMICIH